MRRRLKNQRDRIHSRTPISIEREFSLYHLDNTPVSRSTTRRFIRTLEDKLKKATGTFEVVEEVAGNSFELKACFSNPLEIRYDLIDAYLVANAEARRRGIQIMGISPPTNSEEFNGFFTTLAFPTTKSVIGATNSIHIHIGGENERELLVRYRLANIIAPLILDMSQSSLFEGEERGRANNILHFLRQLPIELSEPWAISSFKEFESRMDEARIAVQDYILEHGNGNVPELCSNYPEIARINGHGFEMIKLTPDKLFHLARLRPDKKAEERGLIGSVEIRTIDGQATVQRDLALIELTIGLLAYMETRAIETKLGSEEIQKIIANTRMASFSPNQARKEHALRLIAYADDGMEEIGLETVHLYELYDMIERPPYLDYSNLNQEKVISRATKQFTQSLG